NLDRDGLVYVLAPARWRRMITRLLAAHSLSIELAILHHPNWTTSRYLVPIQTAPIEYAFTALAPARESRRWLARLALVTPLGEKGVSAFLPAAGLVARRPSARRICEWLFRRNAHSSQVGTFLIQSSWRGATTGGVVVYHFPGTEPHPDSVAKVATTAHQEWGQAQEAKNLIDLAPKARDAGVRVPRLLAQEKIGDRTVLYETALRGQALSILLAQHPARSRNLLEQLVNWLAHWNQSTRIIRRINPEELNRAIIQPAQRVTPFCEQGEDYLNWLIRRCEESIGVPMPFVAAHNDLTMANIVQSDDGIFGILDWEAARRINFPLTDLFYMYVDAVAAAQVYTSRLRAFEACFISDGTHSAHFKEQQQRILRAIELPGALYDLCLHACWLHHAVNEQRASTAISPRPFLEIVQWLARNYQSHATFVFNSLFSSS
ncbi:MAG TPA: phosphotransferase, partial [Anaerolineae bacterium]|nr:phosphotransferase [Anaerolineae bacterium]